jgi:hypothetical protein
MSYTQAQLNQIAASLGDQKIDEILAASAGVDSKNEQGSTTSDTKVVKPTTVTSTAVGPTPPQPESDKTDLTALAGNPRPREGLQSFNILEICSRTTFSKEKEHEVSTFLPSAHRLYAILHELDMLQIQNRYFRQAIPSFIPTQSRIYMGILFIVQTFRAMNHAGILSFRDKQFLTTFLTDNPVTTLPIPGPLLPVLQSLCVSNPQDATLPRVSPSIPTQLGPAQAQQLFVGSHNYAIPNIPLLFGLHEYLRATVVATGAARPQTDVILTAMGIDAPSTAAITLNGFVFPIAFGAPVNANQAWTVTSPGIGQPIEISDDLLDSFKSNIRFFRPPVLTANMAIRDFGEFTRVFQGTWFATLKRNMASYCRFVKGSGTLQDIKVEGPASSQVVAQASTVNILPQPTGFFQTEIANAAGVLESSLLPGDATYTTSLPANDRIAELLSIYTQTHLRVQNHPSAQFNHIGEDGTANGRQGLFWDVRPLQPQTLPDHVKDSLGSEIALYICECVDKD